MASGIRIELQSARSSIIIVINLRIGCFIPALPLRTVPNRPILVLAKHRGQIGDSAMFVNDQLADKLDDGYVKVRIVRYRADGGVFGGCREMLLLRECR